MASSFTLSPLGSLLSAEASLLQDSVKIALSQGCYRSAEESWRAGTKSVEFLGFYLTMYKTKALDGVRAKMIQPYKAKCKGFYDLIGKHDMTLNCAP